MCDPSLERFRIDAVKALLKEDNPAYTLYNYYMKSECESYDDLYESIWYPLNDLVERNNAKSNTKNKVDLER